MKDDVFDNLIILIKNRKYQCIDEKYIYFLRVFF